MNVERHIETSASEPGYDDPHLWHALRPEIRSTKLGWADLKELAARQLLRPDDFVWHPAWETWRVAGDVPGLFPSAAPKQEMPAEAVVEKATLVERARRELQSYLIISAYIWVILNLLKLHQALLADAYHFTIQSQGYAFVTALVLGKVVVIAEAMQFGGNIGRRVPALSILIRSVLFAAAIVGFHAIEELTLGLGGGQSFSHTIASISSDTVWRSVITASIITIALLPYFLVKEIERRTGESDLLLLAVGLKR